MNYYGKRGNQIKSIDDLLELSNKRKSICIGNKDGKITNVKPASSILYNQAMTVLSWIEKGVLFEYIKPKKENNNYHRKNTVSKIDALIMELLGVIIEDSEYEYLTHTTMALTYLSIVSKDISSKLVGSSDMQLSAREELDKLYEKHD